MKPLNKAERHQQILDDRAMTNRGNELMAQIKAEQAPEINLPSSDWMALKSISTPGDWLSYQKAAQGEKSAIAKIGQCVVRQVE